jgi:hypothetical protein
MHSARARYGLLWIAARCGSRTRRGYVPSAFATRGNQVMRVVADRASAGAGRSCRRGRSRTGLFAQENAYPAQAFSPPLGTTGDSLSCSPRSTLCAWWRCALSQRHLCEVAPSKHNAPRAPKGAASAFIPTKRGSIELRERQVTAEGRAKLREQVAVEHTLAHVGRGPGPTYPLSRGAQESLRLAPLRRRSQFTCPGSFLATFC